MCLFFFKQKTAYEMRISDWSSDVCSSDLKAFAELWAKRTPRTAVKNRNEAITLASIVEKETAVPAERRTVAGVYTNRLGVGMRLQADPTIIYPVTKGKPLGRRILRSEIQAVKARKSAV